MLFGFILDCIELPRESFVPHTLPNDVKYRANTPLRSSNGNRHCCLYVFGASVITMITFNSDSFSTHNGRRHHFDVLRVQLRNSSALDAQVTGEYWMFFLTGYCLLLSGSGRELFRL